MLGERKVRYSAILVPAQVLQNSESAELLQREWLYCCKGKGGVGRRVGRGGGEEEGEGEGERRGGRGGGDSREERRGRERGEEEVPENIGYTGKNWLVQMKAIVYAFFMAGFLGVLLYFMTVQWFVLSTMGQIGTCPPIVKRLFLNTRMVALHISSASRSLTDSWEGRIRGAKDTLGSTTSVFHSVWLTR